jgi:hypothetical protein
MAILVVTPAGYVCPENLGEHASSIFRVKEFGSDGRFRNLVGEMCNFYKRVA